MGMHFEKPYVTLTVPVTLNWELASDVSLNLEIIRVIILAFMEQLIIKKPKMFARPTLKIHKSDNSKAMSICNVCSFFLSELI